MIHLGEQTYLLENALDLEALVPLRNANRLYLDAETTAFKFEEYGNNPWRGDRIAGYSVTVDDCPMKYYVPLRHTSGENVPAGQRALVDLIWTAKSWRNQNVKFDAHFAQAECDDLARGGDALAQAINNQWGKLIRPELFCTLTHAKMIDSDRQFKGGYGLNVLSRDMLGKDMGDKDDVVQAYLHSFKTCPRTGMRQKKDCHDYAMVPPDIMGRYAGGDVEVARNLDRYLEANMPEEMRFIWDVETKLTSVLFDVEESGLRVSPEQLMSLQLQILTELAAYEEAIHKLTGMSMQPSNSEHCFELLINRYGLPILAWTEEGGPSFDADALIQYSAHPEVLNSPLLTQVVRIMQLYRDRNTLLTFFVIPYLKKQVNGILHSDYNQLVRTGRESCKNPNAQQLSPDAKELILPDAGCAFLSMDYSQIEFRLMMHFIKDPEAIRAYNENPDQDFHKWVAKICGIPRKPAKTVNFTIGFGGGRKRVVSTLVGNMDLVGHLSDDAAVVVNDPERFERAQKWYLQTRGYDVNDPVSLQMADKDTVRKAVFDDLCQRRGTAVYETYHGKLPGIKIETDICAMTARKYGYVRTALRRRRHLPEKASWRGFNSVVQGSAADLIKERTICLAPRYNAEVRALGIELKAQVHDENLFHGPREVTRDPKVVAMIAKVMESPVIEYRIPIRCSAAWSDKSWKHVDGGELKWREPETTSPAQDAA